MMDSEEREIYDFLKGHANQFIPTSSICRFAAGKHRFREQPDWARSVLLRMQERGILEADATGAFRLKPMPAGRVGAKRWVSPQIASILEKSGQKFDLLAKDDDMDAYYENL
jgi:hypothetical protein